VKHGSYFYIDRIAQYGAERFRTKSRLTSIPFAVFQRTDSAVLCCEQTSAERRKDTTFAISKVQGTLSVVGCTIPVVAGTIRTYNSGGGGAKKRISEIEKIHGFSTDCSAHPLQSSAHAAVSMLWHISESFSSLKCKTKFDLMRSYT
jgi:hypothetical protein